MANAALEQAHATLSERIGQPTEPTDWFEITQDRIDRQKIPERHAHAVWNILDDFIFQAQPLLQPRPMHEQGDSAGE